MEIYNNIMTLLCKVFKQKENNIRHDLLVEILRRLPVKSLVRFKAVHSHWFSLISSPQFCHQHLQYQRPDQKYGTIQVGNTHTLHPSLSLRVIDTVDYDHQLVEIQKAFGSWEVFGNYAYPMLLGSCNGLLLTSFSLYLEDFILWNPTIREYRNINRKIPVGPKFGTKFMAGLGYDNLSYNYKIVAAESRNLPQKTSIEFDIYDLRKSSWKTRNCHFPYKFKSLTTPAITLANGIPHWHFKRMANDQSVILCFDLVEEIFKEVPLPDNILDFKFMSAVDGYLCIGIRNLPMGPLHVWKMREYGTKKSWYALKISFPNKFRCFSYLMPLGFLEKGQVVMSLDTVGIAIFGVATQQYKFVLKSDRNYHDTVVAYNQTLNFIHHSCKNNEVKGNKTLCNLEFIGHTEFTQTTMDTVEKGTTEAEHTMLDRSSVIGRKANGTAHSGALRYALHLRMICPSPLDADEGKLHEVCEPPVVHRNFKYVNILLVDDIDVRVSDCCLAPLITKVPH
ncbi:F-box/kelch-repeat protein At3g23880-like [Mercurialis annua]|uniref:F-box/kelch-repeat protein At3g23880-like n=1 Tax=Mercurialis annua TaxID=3986 RepID=UPI0024AE11E5|nr:F-box/kelch-repeat protein At3g23880-like [Mercurialis annua]